MGIVAVLNSFLLLATIFTVLGTNTSILRLIPEHLVKFSPSSAFRLYRKTQYMVIGISLITGALFFFGSRSIAARIFSKPHLAFYFSMAAVFIVFKSLMLLNTQAVRGLKLIKVFAFMQSLPQGANLVLLLLLGVLFVDKDIPIYALLGSFAVTGITGWAIMEYSFKQRMQTNDLIQTMPARDILSLSLPMLMTATMTFAIGQTGVIMLGMVRSEAEVGYYAIAVKLASLTSFALSAINTMAAPKFSELFHAGKLDELFYVAQKSSKLIFWTTSPILFGLLIGGKKILIIFFGTEFAVAYPALIFLVAGQFVNSIAGPCGYFMNMTGEEIMVKNISIAVSIINILLNLLLIPYFGVIGAAISSMISMSIINLAILIHIKKRHGRTIGYLPLMNWIKLHQLFF